MGFNIIALEDMYEAMNKDENKIKEKLCDFECELNKDVEYFIRECAIESFKASISKTFLVLTSYQKKQVIVGYFSLTTKSIDIKKKYLSNTMIKKKRNLDKDERDKNTGQYLLQMLCYLK